MYHSITFGGKNTWDDWRLIPASRPVFSPPPIKEKTLEIPGANGAVDISEALTGYPLYSNRTGSMEFIVLNEFHEAIRDHREWYAIYSDISDYLHGQKMKTVLEDDKEYYYEGRFTVSDWKSESDFSRIIVNYDVFPYKRLIRSSLEEWLWDSFNFETGVILAPIFKNIPITSDYTKHIFSRKLFGREPVCPEFVVNAENGQGMRIRFVNPRRNTDITVEVPNGRVKIPEFVFYGDSVTLYFKCETGNGTVSIDFVQGRL